jgi:acyl-CoA synthetase (NDP forming)
MGRAAPRHRGRLLSTTQTRRLADVLAPERIALVGASRNPKSLAGRYLDHLVKHRFPGEIIPINRGASEVRGIPAVAALSDVPGQVDCALITLPGDAAFTAALEAAELEIPLVVMFSSGFAEVGAEGRARQAALTEAFAASSSRLLGPNCPGFVNAHAHVGAAISAFVGGHELVPGGVSIVAQSGAVGGLIAERILDRGAGLSHVIFTGNEADVELGEAVATAASSEHCRVVACFLEGFRDPELALAGIAEATAGGTPVMICSVGRSDAGSRAASLHTGKLIAVGEAQRAALRQVGAVLVDDLSELADAAAALSIGARRRGGPRIGLVSTTGGLGAILADHVRETGAELPPTTDSIREALRPVLPTYASVENPCDLADALTTEQGLLQRAVAAFADSGQYDAILLTMAVHPDWLATRLALDLVDASRAVDIPVGVLWPGGAMGQVAVGICRAGGVPVLESGRAAQALLAGWMTSGPLEQMDLPSLPKAAGLAELDLKIALAGAGVHAPQARLVATPGQARAAWKELGPVVVMKVHEPLLDHKAGLGLVRRGIATADGAAETVLDFRRAADRSGFKVGSILVEAQEHGLGLELLVSCRHSELGVEVLLGPGGSTAELNASRAIRLVPVSGDEIDRMGDELGVPEHCRAPLRAGVEGIQRLALAYGAELDTLEVNPLVILGDRAIALDAKLRLT